MNERSSGFRFGGAPARSPVSVKIMLTAMLGILGFGYIIAAANIMQSHQLADGREGMSLDDVKAVYGGIKRPRRSGEEVPSTMLKMLRGSMRQYVGSESDFQLLETWLAAGASEAGLDKGEDTSSTPRRAILRNCLECHAADAGTSVSSYASFGPDAFTVEYKKLTPFLPIGGENAKMIEAPPEYTLPRLILISHMHMLSIPLFTLVVGLLFMMTRWPPAMRNVLTPIPMLALVVDFSGWWLARISADLAMIIPLGGAVFGVVFGIQIIAVVIDLWRPVKT